MAPILLGLQGPWMENTYLLGTSWYLFYYKHWFDIVTAKQEQEVHGDQTYQLVLFDWKETKFNDGKSLIDK